MSKLKDLATFFGRFSVTVNRQGLALEANGLSIVVIVILTLIAKPALGFALQSLQ